LAGIQQEKNSVGFSNINIQPPDANILLNSALVRKKYPLYLQFINSSLKFPECSFCRYKNYAGIIQSGWERSGGERCFEGAYGDNLNLHCGERGGVITDVLFASYGFPSGTCATGYTQSDCHDPLRFIFLLLFCSLLTNLHFQRGKSEKGMYW